MKGFRTDRKCVTLMEWFTSPATVKSTVPWTSSFCLYCSPTRSQLWSLGDYRSPNQSLSISTLMGGQWASVFDPLPWFLLPSILLTIRPRESTCLQPLDAHGPEPGGYPGCISVSSVTQLCPTLCDPMDYSTPGFPVHHQLPELAHSCPLSWWCYPTISSSAIPFSSCLQSGCIYKCGNATLFNKPLLAAFLYCNASFVCVLSAKI